MSHLDFSRRGRTEWNIERRMQGEHESDLNEIGRARAEVAARLLAGLGIEAIYASPLARTRQTVEIIERHVALEVGCDARIRWRLS